MCKINEMHFVLYNNNNNNVKYYYTDNPSLTQNNVFVRMHLTVIIGQCFYLHASL